LRIHDVYSFSEELSTTYFNMESIEELFDIRDEIILYRIEPHMSRNRAAPREADQLYVELQCVEALHADILLHPDFDPWP
jgi:hypothetical protein